MHWVSGIAAMHIGRHRRLTNSLSIHALEFRKNGVAMVRIVIADDHRIALMGLKHFLTGESDIEVVDVAMNASEVIEQVRKSEFDLLILDLSMPGSSGTELLLRVKKERPALPVLILSMYPEEEYGPIALQAGARGYLMKGCTRNELLAAIRQISSGQSYFSRDTVEAASEIVGHSGSQLPHERLSDRQLEVFALLVNGASLTKIGEILNLSVKTVVTHKAHIMQKMGMATVLELVQYAKQHRLFSEKDTI